MGMRPNEVAQMLEDDLKHTSQGTWFLDIVTTGDEDEDEPTVAKTLKTTASSRKIPLHPELIAIGFIQFVERRKTSGGSTGMIFPHLKPDKYGNVATYALSHRDQLVRYSGQRQGAWIAARAHSQSVVEAAGFELLHSRLRSALIALKGGLRGHSASK
jgi:hypothetical protein